MRSRIFAFNPSMETIVAIGMIGLCIVMNLVANLVKGSIVYYLLYHGAFILGICIFLPLRLFAKYNRGSIAQIGITTRNWEKALAVGFIFAALTVPFRLINEEFFYPEIFAFSYTLIGLAMTSLAEEVFFRGYLQTRFEKAFGIIPAMILSGVSFSLYHLGYSEFRALSELVVLFIVGILFALVFRITKNVMTAFIVNFPHAILSFMEKGITLPAISAVFSVLALAIALRIIIKHYG